MVEKEFKHIIRIANTDLKGEKQIVMALQKIKGISHMFANALCIASKIPKNKKAGDLSDKEEEILNKLVMDPEGHFPEWLLNRRRDPETGVDHHLIGGDIKFVHDSDISTLRKLKCYRGIRHALRLPTRGQRTKSNFRPNKGKVAVGKKKTTVRK